MNQIVFIYERDSICNVETKSLKLEDHLTLDIEMFATFCRDQNNIKAIDSYSEISGFVTGFDWKYKSAEIYKNNTSGKIEFNVNGLLKWNIFGITIYNQSKTFKGSFN
ncbi:hypothetical protein [Carboxylicivirga linearis]|uniref:Uncharacterized protein n=1 Tax=Carboxylicivirga linearis TaxID=1628157 RepID=A0ABS5JZ35_9BACT|nr:hypothetical protein [Carboxylicivirga linearis]MBS2100172.1 hypothetical protein [Carboxylicivirga linearis]